MCFAALHSTYGQHNRPTERTIRNTITHLETQHSLLDNIRPNRPRLARSEFILRRDLKLKAYKIKLVQKLKSLDLSK